MGCHSRNSTETSNAGLMDDSTSQSVLGRSLQAEWHPDGLWLRGWQWGCCLHFQSEVCAKGGRPQHPEAVAKCHKSRCGLTLAASLKCLDSIRQPTVPAGCPPTHRGAGLGCCAHRRTPRHAPRNHNHAVQVGRQGSLMKTAERHGVFALQELHAP